jgi:single-stranded DNA-binding protein
MDTDLNHVTLTGMLERNPITRFADHGTQQVHFTLKLTEVGPAGQAFALYVPVEAYSQVAELAGELSAGAAVLVAGKLKWTSYTANEGRYDRPAGLAPVVPRVRPVGTDVDMGAARGTTHAPGACGLPYLHLWRPNAPGHSLSAA